MKEYVIILSDDLSCVYEDIARMNNKRVEECLSIILERAIRTMIQQPRSDGEGKTDYNKREASQ